MAHLKYTVGVASLLLGAVYGSAAPELWSRSEDATRPPATVKRTADTEKLQLVPVSTANRVQTAGRHMTPQKNLDLAWQTADEGSLVTVGLSMINTAVLLEDVQDVAAVDCTGQASVSITFNNTEAFNEAVSEWGALNDSFVMITNHMGDCDSELERSFFVADTDSLASFASNLTVVLQAEKSDVASTASSTSIDFTSVARSVNKRGISWDKDGLSFGYNWTLPSNQTIIQTDYLTMQLNEGQVNNSVRYSGHATWDLFGGITEFYLDLDKSLYHYADIEIAVMGPVSDTYDWTPELLSYAVLEIPGIISLGPAASISFGVTLATVGEVGFAGQFTTQMPNGTVHIDFVNWNESYSRGWEEQKEAVFNITEEITVTIQPFVDFTVEFACSLFGDLLDLSTGVKAEPSFPFVTSASATQSYNSSTGNWTHPNTTKSDFCANGLSEDIDFNFDIIAFATQWVNINLYHYEVDIWDGCLNWLSLTGAK